MSNIRINVGGVDFAVALNSSPLTEKLLGLLPYETMGETWGKEVYFPVDLSVDNPVPVSDVKVGDIAYWPDGPDICMFFGPTPKSTGEAPVVARSLSENPLTESRCYNLLRYCARPVSTGGGYVCRIAGTPTHS
ncbi:MAG: cyclophilin-like fold protein [candidate division WOR-3 bacterium]|nr:cyclophilin-like fold protein [candidate division WOR-3 bacterium]